MPRTIKTVQLQPKPERLLNVAAYARVSNGKDAMLRSLSAQVSFYSCMIQNHKGWNYVGVYSDEAITGTKETRENFQRLLNDCRNGMIDLVITKSISRFARNTVTLLKTVRELKDLSVDVYFEEQNIHTISAEGELMLTVLASYAQEESLSVSENCKWKIRKNFENGISNTFSLYGYEKIDGKIVINESEAQVVRYIFSLYLSGIETTKISKILKNENISSPCGSSWSAATLRETLKNEKYTGNMMLQKYYSKDHLSKRTLKNNGVLPKYYAEDTHPAIISHSDFDKAQMLFARRTKDTDFKRYVNKNASETLPKDEYINEYTKLTKKYEKKAKQRERLISEKEDKFRRADEIRRYVQKMIETKNSVTEWDDTLWVIFLDSAIVNTDGTIEFCFKDGAKIPV